MSDGTKRPDDPESQLTLDKEKMDELYETVRRVYRADERPWVVGYSGGKDSTATLSVVWYALRELNEAQRTKPVYVIASDTGVETPIVVKHLDATISKINASASEQGLPFEAHKVGPVLDDSFWVNMIGRGYPAPTTRFRWCTERLKIKPASRFIEDKVAQWGEVVIVLGARVSESASRAQVMSRRASTSSPEELVTRHSKLAGAWVFTPIQDWTRQDVWVYLLSGPTPWGSSNRDLVTMYKNAQSGECPLVVDKSTPPCGNSRFGCWTCTLVERDKSMEGAVASGEAWLAPLLDLRDWLMKTRDPAQKSKYRSHRRRTGRVHFMEGKEGRKVVRGPYRMEVRKDLLRRLLEAEKQVRAEGPDPDVRLITEDELHRIRQIWQFEEGDWEDSVPEIYQGVYNEDLDWLEEDWSGLGGQEQEILRECCARYSVPEGLLTELLDMERKYHGMSRRSGVYDELDRAMKKDWRSEEAVLAEVSASGECPNEGEGNPDVD